LSNRKDTFFFILMILVVDAVVLTWAHVAPTSLRYVGIVVLALLIAFVLFHLTVRLARRFGRFRRMLWRRRSGRYGASTSGKIRR